MQDSTFIGLDVHKAGTSDRLDDPGPDIACFKGAAMAAVWWEWFR